MAWNLMKMYVQSPVTAATLTQIQTTEEVEEAIKKGLPTEPPVRCLVAHPPRRLSHTLLATQNRDTSQQVCLYVVRTDLYLQLLTILHRYDLLCIEGIARALKVFLEKADAPKYKLVYPPGGESEIVHVTVGPDVRLNYILVIHVLTLDHRPRKSDHSLHAPFSAMSNSLLCHTRPSSTFKINSTRIYADDDSLSRLEPMI